MPETDGFTVAGCFVPVGEIDWQFTAAGGPGGQHANRANTAASASFDIAASPSLPEQVKGRLIPKVGRVVTVRADERRSQMRNREAAIERLEQQLADALVVKKKRRPTRPSRTAKRRRVDEKRKRGETKRLRKPPSRD